MASAFEFPDVTRVLDGTDLDPAAINMALAQFAKQSVSELIASGQASAQYDRYVNRQLGLPEEAVRVPESIVYVFANWTVAIQGAIDELQKRVPRKSGRYAGSFIVIVNDRVVTDYNAIDPNATVTIINRMPYTRKMESGANKTGARHFDLSKAAFNRRFGGAFNAQLVYLNVAPGLVAGVPYILRNSSGRRKDRKAGMPISYPSLILKSVI